MPKGAVYVGRPRPSGRGDVTKRKKVIVCGGRKYTDTERIYSVLDSLVIREGSIFVIHGGAPGADQSAGEWAKQNGVPCAIVPANWNFYGKSAGGRRNGWMLELDPDLVVAFPGGVGTQNMITLAKKHGVPVFEVTENPTNAALHPVEKQKGECNGP